VSMLDELKERNILKLILIMRFDCDTLDVGHPISHFFKKDYRGRRSLHPSFSLGFASPRFIIITDGSAGTYITCEPYPESKKFWSFSKGVDAHKIPFAEKV
jgi:hypothetical protein